MNSGRACLVSIITGTVLVDIAICYVIMRAFVSCFGSMILILTFGIGFLLIIVGLVMAMDENKKLEREEEDAKENTN